MTTTLVEPRTTRRAQAGRYTPSESEREALQTLNNHWRPDDPIRRHYEQQWLTNIAFLIGFQYLVWDPVQRQLIYAQTPTLRWRARAVHNLIRPYVELEVGTVGVFEPGWRGIPQNNDPENVDAAEANQDILKHYWRVLEMTQRKYDMLYWVKTTGNAFIYVGWDSQAGSLIEQPNQMQFQGRSIQTMDNLHEGDLESTIESPFTIYWDNAAPTIDDVQWMIRARARPIEWVELHYPDKANFVPLGVQHDSIVNRQRWVLDLAGPSAAFAGNETTDTKKDWVLVREFFQKPSFDFPNGRYIIDGNGVILEEPKDNPTPKGKLPFIWCRDALVPGRLAGQCNVDNLLSMQRSYNRFVSKKEEHIVLTANAKILEHATNELNTSSFTTEIGEIVKWHGMQAPSYMVPPPMPPETDTEMNRLKQDFDLVTSQYGPARGQYPGKISGKAINYLQEANIQNKTPMLERLTLSLERWGELVLQTAQKYVIEPRLIRIMGRDKKWNVKSFVGQDIGGNTEVSIDIDTMVPKSRNMALEFVAQLTQLGWLSPMNPKDHARVWKALAMESDAPVMEDARLDVRNARNENKSIMMGVPVQPAWYGEDHDVHMMMHTQQAKSDDFKDAPPPIQKMLMDHMQTHLDIVSPKAGVTVPPAQPPEEADMAGDQIMVGGGGGGGAAQQAPMQAPAMQAFS